MPIKYKNKNGLNERKSNQGSMSLDRDKLPKDFKEDYFEIHDQEKIESMAGEKGVTSGDSFDKNLPKNKAFKDKLKDFDEKYNKLKTESDDAYIQQNAMNYYNKKNIIEKKQNYKPRDNA